MNATAATMARGAAAGLVGTAVMTATQALEMRVTGREASTVPGKVAAGLLRLSPNRRQEERLSVGMHWMHGMTGGLLRAGVGMTGLRGASAGAAHFGALWGTDAALYKAFGIAPAPWRWTRQELAVDLFNKGVYAAVTGAVLDRLVPAPAATR